MITHRQITTNNNDNFYSNSQYSANYFIGNSKWTFFQEGGVEQHIDISQQAVANKVEYSNSLSETLGLYYIAKAVKKVVALMKKLLIYWQVILWNIVV